MLAGRAGRGPLSVVRVRVVDQIALGRTGTIEKLLVEVTKWHPVALVVRSAHRLIIAARVRTLRTAGGVAH